MQQLFFITNTAVRVVRNVVFKHLAHVTVFTFHVILFIVYLLKRLGVNPCRPPLTQYCPGAPEIICIFFAYCLCISWVIVAAVQCSWLERCNFFTPQPMNNTTVTIILYCKIVEDEPETIPTSSFSRLWKTFCPDVVSQRPMTDLCDFCQENFVNLNKLAGRTDEEKQQQLDAMKAHLPKADTERQYYNAHVQRVMLHLQQSIYHLTWPKK